MPIRILLLAAGAFTVGTSAYVVAGILPEVSAELGVSHTAAGQLASAFAFTYALGAPLAGVFLGRWDRRTLLLAALGTAALGNAIAAIATTYPLLLVGRIVAALGAAAFTPVATLVATRFMAPEHRGRAVALVFGGLTLALVVGVPAGSLLGGAIGYRGVFWLIALACALAAGAVWASLPRLAAPPVVGLRERFAVAADRQVLTILAMTVLGVLCAMSVYTYIVPLLDASAGVTGSAIGVLLLVYGLGALVGNVLGGAATDRYGAVRTLAVVIVAFVVGVGTLPFTATTMVGAGIALFFWSVATWSFNPPMQDRLISLGGENSGMLLSLNASAIYLGAGLSGVVGGVVIDTLGVLQLPYVAAAIGAASVVLFVLSIRRPRRVVNDAARPRAAAR